MQKKSCNSGNRKLSPPNAADNQASGSGIFLSGCSSDSDLEVASEEVEPS